MIAKSRLIEELGWSGPISNLEAKQKIAERLAREVKDGDVFAAGSGSTSYLATLAIGERVKQEGLRCRAIPTSQEVEMTCIRAGIGIASLWESRPDWGYDGADEVDPAHNLIKGRGGALFREKLVMRTSPRTYILADPSKMVDRLGRSFPIPVEVHPLALTVAESALASLGADEVAIRRALKKDGPVITENGNYLLDVRFAEIGAGLEREIKSITGVIESGLFWGFSVEILT